MAVPKEILAVERPKNTVVETYGKNKDRYAVRERIGCKRKNGKSYPVNGRIIGHIIYGQYVPKNFEKPKPSPPEYIAKDWGMAIEFEKVNSGLLTELKKFFPLEEAETIYCIALLRAMYPGIKDSKLKIVYDYNFISNLYPDLSLSKNSVSKFMNELGKNWPRILDFLKSRVQEIGDYDPVVFDGTLKLSHSKRNSFSAYSWKAPKAGEKQLSLLFSFDLDKMEPIVAKCYPGNMVDSTAFSDFIKEFDFKKGFMFGDKSFSKGAAGQFLKDNPDLHILFPLKRNTKYIKLYDLYDYEAPLPGFDDVLYKKVSFKEDGRTYYLYSFLDVEKAAKEEKDYVARAKRHGEFNGQTFLQKRSRFGTIILESDLDLKPEEAYQIYRDRWIIETLFKHYKNTLGLTDTRVHQDSSIIASEFINFLSMVCFFEVEDDFRKKGLLDKNSYKEITFYLSRIQIGEIKPGEWRFRKLLKKQEKLIKDLELNEYSEKILKRKSGKPKGSTTSSHTEINNESEKSNTDQRE